MSLIKVAVHDGVFHADDVFSVAILEMQMGEIELIRTRETELLKHVDYRVDVGGAYNPSTGDFDHHLVQGVGERGNGIPYASCGLIWKEFGLSVARTKFKFDHIDRKIIQSVDAVDCGYNFGEEKLDYSHYNISDVIDSYNPVWFEEQPDHDRSFKEAVKVARAILQHELSRAEGFEKAADYVHDALYQAVNPHYIVLEKYCPWQHVVSTEPDILYVIFPSTTGDWRIRAVPTFLGSFESKKPLPASWAGLRESELAEVSGVKDATFCHPARFIAGARSREGVLKLVEQALR